MTYEIRCRAGVLWKISHEPGIGIDVNSQDIGKKLEVDHADPITEDEIVSEGGNTEEILNAMAIIQANLGTCALCQTARKENGVPVFDRNNCRL